MGHTYRVTRTKWNENKLVALIRIVRVQSNNKKRVIIYDYPFFDKKGNTS